jgi:hypothetical protein
MADTAWIALASALGGAVVAGGLTYLTAVRAARDARENLQTQLGHERRLARENRQYADLSRCYEAVMLEIQRSRYILAATLPFVGYGDTPPPPPTEVEYRALLALAFTFGSKEVHRLLEAWAEAVRDFAYRVEVLETTKRARIRDANWEAEYDAAEARIDPARQAAYAACNAVADQVHSELHPV